jgi:hypothetical protein
MHSQTVTTKHFNSSNPLPFEQRRFRVQKAGLQRSIRLDHAIGAVDPAPLG